MQADKAVRIDRQKTLLEAPESGHNRWHPGIEPVLSVDPGEVVCIDTRDAYDGQLGPDSVAEDVARLDVGRIHPLTGPIHVNGAEPGDVLEVEVLEVQPGAWGYGLELPGVGPLGDYFREPWFAGFDLGDDHAVSPQIPGVRLPAAPFMGLMGVAPDHEFLQRTLAYESALDLPSCQPVRARSAVPDIEVVRSQGLVTIPPRSNGGNLDIKQCTAGVVVRLPVQVEGARFSTGDAHYTQADGECITGLEMSATLYCRFGLSKGEARQRGMVDPEYRRDSFFAPPEIAVPKRFHATTGQSFDYNAPGTHDSMSVAARNALLNMVRFLEHEYGYDPQQAYMIVSLAADLKISQAANHPNFTASVLLPLDIFD